MDPTVNILWLILLIVTVLALPVLIVFLHKTWNAARSIEQYLLDMKMAGLGVADNTEHIKALDDTISVASDILEVAGDVNEHSNTIKDTLATRAEGSG